MEDVYSPFAGLWDVTRRTRLSVLQGFQQGFTDRTAATRLLEAKACAGGIIYKVPVSEAFKRGLVNEQLNQQL